MIFYLAEVMCPCVKRNTIEEQVINTAGIAMAGKTDSLKYSDVQNRYIQNWIQ